MPVAMQVPVAMQDSNLALDFAPEPHVLDFAQEPRPAVREKECYKLSGLQLRFSVSRDEEYVHLDAARDGQPIQIDFGARKSFYLLLTLARRRLQDFMNGVPETSCGWMYADELARGGLVGPEQMNVDIYRIRRLFAGHGVLDWGAIIERRTTTREIRIGTGRISIESV
jgi:hypothetical protein